MFMSGDDPNEQFYGTNGPRPVKHNDHPKDLKPTKGTAKGGSGGKPKATMRTTSPARGGRSGRR